MRTPPRGPIESKYSVVQVVGIVVLSGPANFGDHMTFLRAYNGDSSSLKCVGSVFLFWKKEFLCGLC